MGEELPEPHNQVNVVILEHPEKALYPIVVDGEDSKKCSIMKVSKLVHW